MSVTPPAAPVLVYYVCVSAAHLDRSQWEGAVGALPVGQRSDRLWELRPNTEAVGPPQQSLYVIGQFVQVVRSDSRVVSRETCSSIMMSARTRPHLT